MRQNNGTGVDINSCKELTQTKDPNMKKTSGNQVGEFGVYENDGIVTREDIVER